MIEQEWIVVDSNPIYTGVFNSVDFSQTFSVDTDDFSNAAGVFFLGASTDENKTNNGND